MNQQVRPSIRKKSEKQKLRDRNRMQQVLDKKFQRSQNSVSPPATNVTIITTHSEENPTQTLRADLELTTIIPCPGDVVETHANAVDEIIKENSKLRELTKTYERNIKDLNGQLLLLQTLLQKQPNCAALQSNLLDAKWL
uniref:Uncharacterized protein n=1 Tax=Magallana gigas TaxID=29159 RepID=K1RIW8_MAGGI